MKSLRQKWKFHIHRPKIWKFCNFSYVYVHNSKTIWPTDLILVLYQRQFCVLYDHLAKPLIYLSFILKLMQKLRFYPKFDVLSPRNCRGRGSKKKITTGLTKIVIFSQNLRSKGRGDHTLAVMISNEVK